jgi:Rrf2 family protein
MIFSKAIEYGIKASIYVAQQSMNGYRSNLKDISEHIDSPEAFTAKILQQLVKGGIIRSIKGAGGGFALEIKEMKKIKLADIVLALDADFLDSTCVLGLKHCSETNPCPVHHKYKGIKKETLHLLKNTTLLEMSTNLDKGLAYLKN